MLATALLSILSLGAQSGARQLANVGMPARIEELVLPGSRLEVVPLDIKSPLALRITAASAHGDAFRYDLEYTGLDPGTYDLRDYLRRQDRSATDELPPIEVEIRSVLAAEQTKPHAPPAVSGIAIGGYRAALIAGALAWAAGLVVLLRSLRKKREHALDLARPRTLADRLRPLIERALAGELSHTQCAELEASLIAYWRRKLDLEAHAPAQALALMRAHEQAGPLLTSLEAWLHHPAAREPADIAALLAPYRDLAPDALENVLERTAERAALEV